MDRIKKLEIKKQMSGHIMEIILLVMIIFMAFKSPYFLTFKNFINIFRTVSITGVVAFGMTMVLIGGEIDLSVPSMSAISGVIAGLVCGHMSALLGLSMDVTIWFGVLASFGFALLVGFMNGWLITRFKLPAFIVTMSMMNIIYGIAAVISGGFPVITLPAWFSGFGAGTVIGVPVPAFFLFGVFILLHILMNYTKLGRAVYAAGGNAEAARLSGIDVSRIKTLVMMFSSICACLCGLLLSSQVMSGSFNFSKGLDGTAISAAVIGGTSFSGGSGKMWGTFIGIIFVGTLVNAMTLLNINDYVQYIVRGLLTLMAVLLNIMQNSKKA